MDQDLAARLRAVVEERLAVARAATPGPWVARVGRHGPYVEDEANKFVQADTPFQPNAAHIALNDPADAFLAAEHALWLLDQHKRIEPGVNCGCDLALCRCGEHVPWPCEDLVRMARRYRVEVDG